MEEKEKLTTEVAEGFDFVSPDGKIVECRLVRRRNVAKFKKYLPMVKREMLATQEAFEKNFPGFLEAITEAEVWELVDEENKTRKATFYKRLFKIELYFTAMTEYIRTNGKKDILQEMHMSFSENELKKALADKLADPVEMEG